MKTIDLKRYLSKLALALALPAMMGLASCSEDIDESNLYTFTGETIEDYLNNNADRYSSFIYILQRAGMDKILSGYGQYTCFAPNNESLAGYIDSLYNDNTRADHNGMSANSLEGLSDSLCNDIAKFHLLSTKVQGIDMGNGMTITTMLGRDINTSIDSISGNVAINVHSLISTMDVNVENGVVHEISDIIHRSNRLVSGELEQHKEFALFTQALNATGLADSLTAQERTDIEKVEGTTFYVPESSQEGYTILAETDEALAAAGINSFEDMVAKANELYAHCADPGSGWYDYPMENNIEISTGSDYENPWNCLNMFIRYHILKYKVSYNKLVYSYNESAGTPLYEYYETMLPYTLYKVQRVNGKYYVNRWVLNNTLTNQIAAMGTADMHPVRNEGIEMQSDNISALNGYIHPIKGLHAYTSYVPRGVLNERMRFDIMALLPEMMSNSFRGMADEEIKAMNGGKSGSDANLGGDYIRFPSNFFRYLRVYNGSSTRLMYLPGRSNGWSNYQGDEFNCLGAYDFSLRLPPVPSGTYELRIGYTANTLRGMVQFYMGPTSAQSSMMAVDVPLDMRVVPANNADGSPSSYGWCDYTKTEDMGVETDKAMHNNNWMRGPLAYTVGVGGNVARLNAQDLRRIIVKQGFKQGDVWLRFKTVLPDYTNTQFHLDYIEFCPENVYNNRNYLEDMY